MSEPRFIALKDLNQKNRKEIKRTFVGLLLTIIINVIISPIFVGQYYIFYAMIIFLAVLGLTLFFALGFRFFMSAYEEIIKIHEDRDKTFIL